MIRSAILLIGLSATSASAVTLSAGYKGQGVHNLMKSDGAVMNVRPIPNLGFSYSYNYATANLIKSIESEDKFFNDVTARPQAVDVTEAVISRHLHEAQLRWYPMGGSFFFGAGAMAGKFNGSYSETAMSGSSQVSKSYSGTTTYSSFALGNIWEFKNIMLGAEWAGVSKNLSHSQKVTESGSASEQSSSDKSFESYMKLFTAYDSISVMMVHLGVSL